MLSLLANWRLILAGSAIAAALAGWAYIAHLRSDRDKAQTLAQSATRQASINAETSKALDHYTATSPQRRERADNAVQQIQSAPTADQKLDPGFRSILCNSGLCLDPDKPDDNGSDHLPG